MERLIYEKCAKYNISRVVWLAQIKKSSKKVKANRNVPKAAKKAAGIRPAPKPAMKAGKRAAKPKTRIKPVASAAVKKKTAVKVVSNEPKGPTPEEKLKLEELHRILSDAYVRQMLIEIGGENALEIVRHFHGNHSDEQLAKDLTLRISDVRATLNRLHNEGLVQYAREKDSETGWYSYSWSLNMDRIVRWVGDATRKGTGANAEGNDYYFCPGCGLGSIVGFEIASTKEFRCDKCNKSLEFIEEERFSAINQFLRK